MLLRFYKRLQNKFNSNKRLILINKPKSNKLFKEVLLHEFIHELIDSNRINIKSFKWNEGITAYLTYYALGKQREFYKKLKSTKNKIWNIYSTYARKWTIYLKDIQNPQQRKNIILKKVKIINKLKKSTKPKILDNIPERFNNTKKLIMM